MNRSAQRWSFVLLGLVFLLGRAAAPASAMEADKARKKLEKKGIDFTSHEFVGAAESGKKEIVELFLAAGMSPTEPDQWAATPLGAAIGRSQLPIVSLLLEAGADVNAPASRAGCSALEAAVEREGDVAVQITKLVLQAGADPEAGCGRPMYSAIVRDRAEQVAALLEAGVQTGPLNESGETPIHIAASYGRIPVLSVLIQAGAEIDGRDRGQATPLILAARGARPDAVEMLLAAGADANAADSMGSTALIEAAGLADPRPAQRQDLQALQMPILRTLLQAGANVNTRASRAFRGETATIAAAAAGNTEAVRALIAAGADVNLGDRSNALTEAAKGGHADIVRLLLDSGAGVQAKDGGGKTALDWAEDHPEVFEMLQAKGALSASKYSAGRPAAAPKPVPPAQRDRAVAALKARGYSRIEDMSFLQAAVLGETEVVRLFLEAGMPVDTKDPRDHSTTALLRAAQLGHPEVVLLLLEAGANPNAGEGMALIYAAGGCGMTEAVRALIERGADLDARAPGGITPLGSAKLYNCEATEALLRKAGATADMALPASGKKTGAAAKSGKASAQVKKPDYWAKLEVGAWSEFHAQPGGGIETRMKWTVRRVTPEKVVYLVEMSTYNEGRLLMNGIPTEVAYDKTNVLSDPDAKVTTSETTVTIKDKLLKVTIYSTEGEMDGVAYVVNSWMSEEVPFGLVKLESGGAVTHQLVDWGWGP